VISRSGVVKFRKLLYFYLYLYLLTAIATRGRGFESRSWHLQIFFLGYLADYLGDVTTQVNLALHSFGVAKSSTSFGWGKGGKITSAGWKVTLGMVCDFL